jgi:hypothetical protein
MNKGGLSPLARISQKKYIVAHTSEERQQLEQISRTGKASAYQIIAKLEK